MSARQASYQALEQAAHWYAELRCGEADSAQHAAWRRWLAADPAHRAAWDSVQSISSRFEPLHHLPDLRGTGEQLLGIHQRVRRRAALRSLAALAGCGLLYSSWRLTPLHLLGNQLLADYRSGVGEMRQVRLPDGSQVWLNTLTAFDLNFSNDLRLLRLLSGEVLIDTAHDNTRPFVVSTACGRLRALGTRFSVRLQGNTTRLSVFAGAVEASPANGGASRVVQAGQQQVLEPQGLAASGQVDPARQAWTEGMLLATDIPLAEVLDELASHHLVHLSVSPQVAGLKVFGNLPLGDLDSALAILAEALPIRIQQPLPWWTSVGPRA